MSLTVLLARLKKLQRINVQPVAINVQLALVLATPNAFLAHRHYSSKAQLSHAIPPAIQISSNLLILLDNV